MEMQACQTPRWAETWCEGESEARPNFETGNQEEGKGGRHTGSQAQEGQPGAKASPASASPSLWQQSPSRALTGQDF